MLVLFFAFSLWLLPKIWRGLKRVAAFIRRKLGGAPEPSETAGTVSGEDNEGRSSV